MQVDLRTNMVPSLALGDRSRAAAGASAFYGERLRDFVFGWGVFSLFSGFLYIFVYLMEERVWWIFRIYGGIRYYCGAGLYMIRIYLR